MHLMNLFTFSLLAVLIFHAGILQINSANAAEEVEHTVNSKFSVSFYGYLKFDAAYDTARTSTGNFGRWVESERMNENDDQLNLTANQSRFGLVISGPNSHKLETSGKIEIDFYGGGSENKANPMMRQAYLNLHWTQFDVSILAGQTNDVISPLVPTTINYTVAWWVGNIGYRRPMVRLTKKFGKKYPVKIQVAATRTIGDQGEYSPGDTGEDAGVPTFQSRVAFTIPSFSNRNARIGVSGHWGVEEYDYNEMGHCENYETWSANLDLMIPLGNMFTFKSELWMGDNLDAYLGGIGQGINVSEMEEITGTGGWAALTIALGENYQLNCGGSYDDPDDKDLAPGDRSLNTTYWTNLLYDVNKAVRGGLEVSYWNTEYKEMKKGDSVRIHATLMYTF